MKTNFGEVIRFNSFKFALIFVKNNRLPWQAVVLNIIFVIFGKNFKVDEIENFCFNNAFVSERNYLFFTEI